jgi:hypothetical protein
MQIMTVGINGNRLCDCHRTAAHAKQESSRLCSDKDCSPAKGAK